MGGLAFLDLLTEEGYYTQQQKEQIIVTVVTDLFLKTKPTLSQAHRVRTVMQNYYLFKRGAYEIKDGRIYVNLDKVVPAAKEMLSEIVRVQIDDDFAKAEKYVLDNFIWTDEMQLIGVKFQKVSKELIKIRRRNPILLADNDDAGRIMKKVNEKDSILKVCILSDVDEKFKTIESLFAQEDLQKFNLLDENGKFVKHASTSTVFKNQIQKNSNSISKTTKDNFEKLFKYLEEETN